MQPETAPLSGFRLKRKQRSYPARTPLGANDFFLRLFDSNKRYHGVPIRKMIQCFVELRTNGWMRKLIKTMINISKVFPWPSREYPFLVP